MATFLITGVAGFIGSHLAHALVDVGETVRGLDNFSTGRIENLVGLEDKLDLLEIDLCNAAGVRAACEGVDVVLHQGALPSVPRSVKDPRPSHESNVNGTFNLLEGARAAGVKRVVYAASSSAYGNQPGFPRRETMTPQPIAPYPVQKLAGELYMQSYWRVYGLETVCLRYFNIFGPRQVPDSPYSGVMAKFVLQMMQGEQPTIHGDGEQGRDFTYVDNAVQANLLAAHAPAGQVAGRVFNVASGERHTLNETYGVIAGLLGFAQGPLYEPERAGDVRDSLADITAAAEAMGYEPRVGFADGLAADGGVVSRAGGGMTGFRPAETLAAWQARVEDRTARVGIVGLGYVGLPLALLLSEDRFRVLGFDTDASKVETLNAGRSYIHRITTEDVNAARCAGFVATTDFARAAELDAILICVPTPLYPDHTPDMRAVVATMEALAPHVQAGQLVVLESTTYPGTTEEIVAGTIERVGTRVLRGAGVAGSHPSQGPYFPQVGTGRKYDLRMCSTALERVGEFDCVMIVTDHTSYDYARIVSESKLVIDSRNATRGLPAEQLAKVVRC